MSRQKSLVCVPSSAHFMQKVQTYWCLFSDAKSC